jgi:hypothetical protein
MLTTCIDRFLVAPRDVLLPQLTVRDVAKQQAAQTLLPAATASASAVTLSSDGTVLAAAHSSNTTATTGAVGSESLYDNVTVWKLQSVRSSRASSSRSGTSSNASAKQQWQRVSTVQCSGRVQALLLYGKGGAHLYT